MPVKRKKRMRKFQILFVLASLLTCADVFAEGGIRLVDSLTYRVEAQATVGGGDHNPLWLNANRYGLSSLKNCNGYLRASLERPLSVDSERKWGIGYGVDMAKVFGYTSQFVLQQAYIEARWLKGALTVGSKQHPLELKNAELSSGSQTLGINARPVPMVRLSLPDYWALPFTKGWVSIKGHIAYGKTTDDKWQKEFTGLRTRYTEGSWLHTKAAYIKIGNSYRFMPVSFEFGLEMAAQFGGTTFMGSEMGGAIIKNEGGIKGMWHALIPGGGDSTDGDAYQNASGNQLGSWVMRLNFDYDSWYLGVYADQFFEDHSMLTHLGNDGYGTGDQWNTMITKRYFVYSFKDWQLGLDLRLKNATWLNNIVLEYITTKYQGGPVYHDHTPAISDQISGRDNYYNHHLFTGWQHWGQVMGNPLYLSPLYNEDGTIMVKNNRFTAWHIGLAGDPNYYLHYRVLATFQKGYGTYDAPYWDPKKTFSILAEATYHFPDYHKLRGWSIRGAVAFDTGKLYGKNFGCQVTIAKTGLLNFKKSRVKDEY